MLNYNNGKTKEQRKRNYMCTRYYFEIVRSGQRSRAFGLATTTVQLIIRGGYLQNIHIHHGISILKTKEIQQRIKGLCLGLPQLSLESAEKPTAKPNMLNKCKANINCNAR